MAATSVISPVAGQQHHRVDGGCGDADDDRDDVVDVEALETAGDAAVDAEREVQRNMHADDEQDPLSRLGLLHRHVEDVVEVEREDSCDAVGQQSGGREDEEHGARDLVQRARVAARPVLRHELDDRAAVAQVEDGEVNRHRAEQHPEPVLARRRDAPG